MNYTMKDFSPNDRNVCRGYMADVVQTVAVAHYPSVAGVWVERCRDVWINCQLGRDIDLSVETSLDGDAWQDCTGQFRSLAGQQSRYIREGKIIRWQDPKVPAIRFVAKINRMARYRWVIHDAVDLLLGRSWTRGFRSATRALCHSIREAQRPRGTRVRILLQQVY